MGGAVAMNKVSSDAFASIDDQQSDWSSDSTGLVVQTPILQSIADIINANTSGFNFVEMEVGERVVIAPAQAGFPVTAGVITVTVPRRVIPSPCRLLPGRISNVRIRLS